MALAPGRVQNCQKRTKFDQKWPWPRGGPKMIPNGPNLTKKGIGPRILTAHENMYFDRVQTDRVQADRAQAMEREVENEREWERGRKG